jgi:hypothetical protein
LFRYVSAFAEAGFVVERMLEPWPPGDVADSASETPADASFAAAVPRLLYLRLRREERVSSLRPDG